MHITIKRFQTKPLALAIGAVLIVTSGMQLSAYAATSQSASMPATTATTSQTAGKGSQSKTPVQLKGMVVHGVRQAQMKSIELKRVAPNIQDSITAQNIGELPDVTIADSLSRIPGVEIDRSAGQGGATLIDGLPQIGTTLNGEAFITPSQITSNQPNFISIPASLFAGADVIKSNTASTTNAGITGTINLRTWEPLNLKKGWTSSVSIQDQYGSVEKKTKQPQASFLVAYHGSRWGVLLSGSYSNLTLNSTTDNETARGRIAGEGPASAQQSFGFVGAWLGSGLPVPPQVHQLANGGVDVNGDGKDNAAFYHGTFGINTDDTKRVRKGLSAAIQGDLGSGLRLTVNGFLADLQEFDRQNGYEFLNTVQNGAFYVPLDSHPSGGKVVPSSLPSGASAQDFYTSSGAIDWPGDLETYDMDTVTSSISRNFSAKLDFNNGGPFTGSVRIVNASASSRSGYAYVQNSTSDGSNWHNDPINAAPPGSFVTPNGIVKSNPQGIVPASVGYTVHLNGDGMSVTAPPGILTRLANPDTWGFKILSDGYMTPEKTEMNISRADGQYDFFQGLGPFDSFAIDFGVRDSIRSAREDQYTGVTPLYAGQGASSPNGCMVHWMANDEVLNGGGLPGACSAGNSLGFFLGNPHLTPNSLPAILKKNQRLYTNLGNSTGGVTVLGVDPKIMDNLHQFRNAVTPGATFEPNPSNTWNVLLVQKQAYAQINFGTFIGNVSINGNVGARFVHTNLLVTQSVTGAAQPYGAPDKFGGSTTTLRSYNDVLPAVNVKLGFTQKLDLRLAYAKEMMPLSLSQWGGGLSVSYIPASHAGITNPALQGIDFPGAASSGGSPDLQPWRSRNFAASLEYYFQPGALVSISGFDIKVNSFVTSGTVENCSLPDSAGVVTGICVPESGPVQGAGGSLKGLSGEYQQGLTFLPGFLSDLGITANYTYSPSTSKGRDIAGRKLLFPDSSAKSGNLILWYDNGTLNIRAAGNYRSRRAVSANFDGIPGMELYQSPTIYYAFAANYQISKQVQVFFDVQNVSNEHEHYYLVYPGQTVKNIYFQRTYIGGVRLRF